MSSDAALADVQFVDRSTGWAVSDRGAIWHTADGGNTWQRQESPVSCRLNAVFFLDRQQGWAVGGTVQPYSQATRGVVLRRGGHYAGCSLLSSDVPPRDTEVGSQEQK